MKVFIRIKKQFRGRKAGSFRREEDGGIMILFALSLAVLFGILTLAVDLPTSLTREATLEGALRAGATEPAKAFPYMWLTCELDATPVNVGNLGIFPSNIRCIENQQALRETEQYISQQFVDPIMGGKVSYTVKADLVKVASTGNTFLYVVLKYDVEKFFNIFGKDGNKSGTVKVAKMVIDVSPPNYEDVHVYAVGDASANSNLDSITPILSRARSALQNLGYPIGLLRGGAHLYGPLPQCPNGNCGWSGAEDPRFYWDGGVAGTDESLAGDGGNGFAVQDRIWSVTAQFYAQPIRTCNAGYALWTYKTQQSNKACRTRDNQRMCSYAAGCSQYENVTCPDDAGPDGVAGNADDSDPCQQCKPGFELGVCVGCGCCDDQYPNGDYIFPEGSPQRMTECLNCQDENEWYKHDYCFFEEPYQQVVYYHSCPQADTETGAKQANQFLGFGGYITNLGQRLRFEAEYCGPTPDCAAGAYPGIPKLIGTVSSTSTASPPAGFSLQTGELRDITQINTRRNLVYQCNPGSANTQFGHIANIDLPTPASGGEEFYNPPTGAAATCVSPGNGDAGAYSVTFRPQGCSGGAASGCDIKAGYWKVYAIAQLSGPWRVGATPFDDQVYALQPMNTHAPAPYSTGNCDENAMPPRCAVPVSMECLGNTTWINDGGNQRQAARYVDPVIASPRKVLGEQIYISSLSFESGRPLGQPAGAMLDRFNPLGGHPQRMIPNGANQGENKIRFPNEFGGGDGVLVLDAESDNGRPIPIGMFESSATIGYSNGGTPPFSKPLIQTLAALKLEDGYTPAQNTGGFRDNGVGEIGRIFGQAVNKFSGIDNRGACAAVTMGANMVTSLAKPEKSMLFIAINCEIPNCGQTTYSAVDGSSPVPWATHDNLLYKLVGTGRLQSVACSAADYENDSFNCVAQAAGNAATAGAMVFPVQTQKMIAPNIFVSCAPKIINITTDQGPGGGLGKRYSAGGDKLEDVIRDMAYALIELTGTLGSDADQGQQGGVGGKLPNLF